MKALPKIPRVRHSSQNSRPLRRMWICVDAIDRCFLPSLPTPPVRIAHEEQLLLTEKLETRQMLVRCFCRALLPSRKRCRHATGVCDVLTQCEPAVDMQRLVVGS